MSKHVVFGIEFKEISWWKIVWYKAMFGKTLMACALYKNVFSSIKVTEKPI